MNQQPVQYHFEPSSPLPSCPLGSAAVSDQPLIGSKAASITMLHAGTGAMYLFISSMECGAVGSTHIITETQGALCPVEQNFNQWQIFEIDLCLSFHQCATLKSVYVLLNICLLGSTFSSSFCFSCFTAYSLR